MKILPFEKIAADYYAELSELMASITATDKHKRRVDFYAGIASAARIIGSAAKAGNKLIFIGNGASAAMASHLSSDFWKNVGIQAVAFNDIALLTAVSNDYGYEHVFAKPIEMFAKKGDVLVAISSSGKSQNILNGVKAARSGKCKIITLSGFAGHNPLRPLGDINFYVSSCTYGPVEVVHHSICHCILDSIIKSKQKH